MDIVTGMEFYLYKPSLQFYVAIKLILEKSGAYFQRTPLLDSQMKIRKVLLTSKNSTKLLMFQPAINQYIMTLAPDPADLQMSLIQMYIAICCNS